MDVFPAYRKLKGAQRYYRIDAADHFTEVHFIGERPVLQAVRAAAYPERLRVAEMISGDGGRYVSITEAEWQAVLPPK